jgi:hypothetical protein
MIMTTTLRLLTICSLHLVIALYVCVCLRSWASHLVCTQPVSVSPKLS